MHMHACMHVCVVCCVEQHGAVVNVFDSQFQPFGGSIDSHMGALAVVTLSS